MVPMWETDRWMVPTRLFHTASRYAERKFRKQRCTRLGGTQFPVFCGSPPCRKCCRNWTSGEQLKDEIKECALDQMGGVSPDSWSVSLGYQETHSAHSPAWEGGAAASSPPNPWLHADTLETTVARASVQDVGAGASIRGREESFSPPPLQTPTPSPSSSLLTAKPPSCIGRQTRQTYTLSAENKQTHFSTWGSGGGRGGTKTF